ncbi:MAG: flagellar hook-basal body complex protein FliE [Homoserinimonas sp.]|jgi:flagellar hook-basal body complex protein FliE|nr:flagellar hook-basal body complex protein FliE [Homoserinimonas sp.]
MDISAITSVQGVTGTGYLSPASGASATSGAGFATQLTSAVENLQQAQATSNELAIKAVTGDLDDIHDATIASTQAAVTLELIAAVRNKSIDAFNEIMRMQA